MPAPTLTGPADRLYDWLTPWVGQDPANGYAAAWIALAIGEQFTDVEQIVRTADDGTPGWVRLFDPVTAPVWALPWLAQFAGVIVDPASPEATQRAQIHPDAVKRGSLTALIAAAKRTLTGNQTVIAVERYTGDAYKLLLATYASETPDPVATEAAIRSALIKPVGVVITYATYAGWTVGQLEAHYIAGTIATVEGDFSTVLAIETNTP